jgi:hypothetical protein
LVVSGGATGYAIRDGAAKSAAAKAYKAAEEQRVVMQGKIDLISAQYEEERRRVSSVNVQRTNTIKEFYRDAPAVPAECALPDPMYGLLVNSVRDANVSTGEPSSAVPNTSKPTPTGH